MSDPSEVLKQKQTNTTEFKVVETEVQSTVQTGSIPDVPTELLAQMGIVQIVDNEKITDLKKEVNNASLGEISTDKREMVMGTSEVMTQYSITETKELEKVKSGEHKSEVPLKEEKKEEEPVGDPWLSEERKEKISTAISKSNYANRYLTEFEKMQTSMDMKEEKRGVKKLDIGKDDWKKLYRHHEGYNRVDTLYGKVIKNIYTLLADNEKASSAFQAVKNAAQKLLDKMLDEDAVNAMWSITLKGADKSGKYMREAYQKTFQAELQQFYNAAYAYNDLRKGKRYSQKGKRRQELVSTLVTETKSKLTINLSQRDLDTKEMIKELDSEESFDTLMSKSEEVKASLEKFGVKFDDKGNIIETPKLSAADIEAYLYADDTKTEDVVALAYIIGEYTDALTVATSTIATEDTARTTKGGSLLDDKFRAKVLTLENGLSDVKSKIGKKLSSYTGADAKNVTKQIVGFTLSLDMHNSAIIQKTAEELDIKINSKTSKKDMRLLKARLGMNDLFRRNDSFLTFGFSSADTQYFTQYNAVLLHSENPLLELNQRFKETYLGETSAGMIEKYIITKKDKDGNPEELSLTALAEYEEYRKKQKKKVEGLPNESMVKSTSLDHIKFVSEDKAGMTEEQMKPYVIRATEMNLVAKKAFDDVLKNEAEIEKAIQTELDKKKLTYKRGQFGNDLDALNSFIKDTKQFIDKIQKMVPGYEVFKKFRDEAYKIEVESGIPFGRFDKEVGALDDFVFVQVEEYLEIKKPKFLGRLNSILHFAMKDAAELEAKKKAKK